MATVEKKKREFDLVLLDVPSDAAIRIAVIKVLMDLPDLGLREAKELVEGCLPKKFKRGLSKYEAETIKKQLEAAGATVDIV